jgi:uncharacterized membrane protein
MRVFERTEYTGNPHEMQNQNQNDFQQSNNPITHHAIYWYPPLPLASHSIFSYLLPKFFMRPNTPYRLLIVFVVLWCIPILLPPVLNAVGAGSLSPALYQFFSRICHQDENRSIHLLGYPLGVCARCSAIYFGFFIGTIATGFWRFNRKNFRMLFILILLPRALDVLLDALGMHQTTMLTRIITGLIFGIGSGMLLTPLLVEGIMTLRSQLARGLAGFHGFSNDLRKVPE